MPQNEAIDVARSLSGLSQSLNSVMGKQVEADTAEQVAQAGQAVAGMSKEELEATIGQQWRAAGLPEGADPISQIALLEHAGKRLAKDALQKFRTENMDRFSDPMNTEDPREAMLAEFESLGISGFYASNAATEVYTNEANAFSEQVYQSRAARTAKQNRENLADDIYNESLNFSSGMDPSERSEMASRIVGMIQGSYEKYGFSGRDEAWRGISLAARELAKDDLDAATELINELEQVEIGGRTIEQQFGAEISALEEDLIEISERAEDREFQRDAKARQRRNQLASDAASAIWTEKAANNADDYDPSSPESIQEITQTLIEMGVPESEVNSVVGDVVKGIASYQNAGSKDDPEAVAAVTTMISGPTSLEDTLSTIRQLREEGDLSALMSARLETQARSAKDLDDRMDRAERQDTGFGRAVTNLNRELASDEAGFSEALQAELYEEYIERYREIVRDVVTDPNNAGLDNNRLGAEISKRRRELDKEYLGTLRQLSEDPSKVTTDEGTTEAQREAIEARRELEARDRPEELIAPDTFWDSSFTNTQREMQEAVLQGGNEGLAKQAELKSKLYRLAKERAADVPKTTEVRPGAGPTASLASQRTRSRQPSSKELNDYTRARSVTGISLEELTSRRLNGTIIIDEETLNPKFFVMFDGIESLNDFQALTSSEEGRARITEIYEAIPERYQSGEEQFIKDQISLLRRYR